MKKISFILVLSSLMLLLAACGSDVPETGEGSTPGITKPAAIETPADLSEKNEVTLVPTKEPEVVDNTTENETDLDVEEVLEKLGAFNTSATLEETVMYDANNVKITATGLTYNSWSVELELLIENNSEKDLSFISGSMGYCCNSVNGYMWSDSYMNCDVSAGKKANDSIRFDFDGLMLYGINEIADIEIGFDISDDDYNDIYTGPCQVKTSAYEGHDYTADCYGDGINGRATMHMYEYDMVHFARDVQYEDNGISLASYGLMRNRDSEVMLLLEVLNSSETQVQLSTSDITLNGLAVYSGTWSTDTINPGKRAIVDVNLSSALDAEYWEAYGLKEIGAVALNLSQKDMDWETVAEEKRVKMVMPGVDAAVDTTGTEIYNDNGLRIIAKTIMEDPSEYSEDIHVLLMAENTSGSTLSVDDVYDSLSVNGFMSDYIFPRSEIMDGECAVMEIELYESALEENKITGVADIKEIEFSIEIKEGRNKVAEPKITIMYE